MSTLTMDRARLSGFIVSPELPRPSIATAVAIAGSVGLIFWGLATLCVLNAGGCWGGGR